MIISHSKKCVFFRVTKTGSTTAEVLLRLSGAFDLAEDIFCSTDEWELPALNLPEIDHDVCDIGWRHATPGRLIEWGVMTLEQLREYDCYAFLRPVESRFISGYLHSMRGGVWGRRGKAGFMPKQFMDRWRARQAQFNPQDLLGRAQVDWFFVNGEQIVTPLNFSNYQDELRGLLDQVGGYQYPELPRLNRAKQHAVVQNENRRQWAASIWQDYDDIRAECLARYADDHAFYLKNFGDA